MKTRPLQRHASILGTAAPNDPVERRRALLRALGGGVASAGLGLWLAGCGGGGSDSAGAPGAPSGDSGSGGSGGGSGGGTGGGSGGPVGSPTEPGAGPLTAAERTAAIRSVEERCRVLARQNLEPLAFVQALAAQLAGHPAYLDAGFDAESLNAWAVFRDGRVHVIANSFRPQRALQAQVQALAQAEQAATPAAGTLLGAATKTELPAAATARVLQTFGTAFWECAAVVNDVSSWLTTAGYKTHPAHTASLASLRGVRGDGYFYINTHGARVELTNSKAASQILNVWNPFGNAQSMAYTIQSSTRVSDEIDQQPETLDDWTHRRITYFTAFNGDSILGLQDDWDTRYGITSNFVEKYWQFAPNSVVVINACYSARTQSAGIGALGATQFIFACHKAGAGVFLGWSDTFSPAGFRAARYFTDRLLGANAFSPEVPPQRAFAWDKVMPDLVKKGLHKDPNTAALFLAHAPAAAGDVQALAPSIHHVESDEYRHQLRVHGQFGSQPGTVSIDGHPLVVVQWAAERIVCELPLAGAGSAGPVQVQVRGVKSNLRRLTEWSLPMAYLYRAADPEYRIEGNGTVRVRVDVGLTREAPGATPVAPVRDAYATSDSQLALAIGGQPPCTYTGARTYTAITPGGEDILVSYFKFNTATASGSLGLSIGSANPDFWQTCPGPYPPVPLAAVFGELEGTRYFQSPVEGRGDQLVLGALSLAITPDYRLAAKDHLDPLAWVHWPVVPPRFAPQLTDAL